MRTRPMLFSAPMVRALRDGTKTQMRRLVVGSSLDWLAPGMLSPEFVAPLGNRMCPYGVTGDLLWVRETFAGRKSRLIGNSPLWYRADGETKTMQSSLSFYDDRDRWRPSIHMPRWASRLTLEINDVRLQRVQDITEADAQAEGAAPKLVPPDGGSYPHVEGFCDLWNSIYAKGGYGWAENPFVWALSFFVHHANVDAVLARRAA